MDNSMIKKFQELSLPKDRNIPHHDSNSRRQQQQLQQHYQQQQQHVQHQQQRFQPHAPNLQGPSRVSQPRNGYQQPSHLRPSSIAQNKPATSHSSIKYNEGPSKLRLPHMKVEKPSGKTEAEIQLDLMTSQLEEELEAEEKAQIIGTCEQCGKDVEGERQACQAMGKLYHTSCFICISCGRSLKEKAFYNVNGKIYCEEDYLYSGFQQTAEKCAICGHLIMEMILHAMDNFYHPGCFRCCYCNECLDGVPFTVDFDNKLYCVKDFHKIFAAKCAACQKSITPINETGETIRVVAMDKDFHVDCYVCEECNTQLTDEPDKRCFPLNGRLLCKSCHQSYSQ